MPDDTEESLNSEGAEDAAESEASAGGSRDAKDVRIEELTDTVKRTQAEFENYKKRIEREWAERARLAGERVIVDLLAVLDTLDKAVEDARDGAGDGPGDAGLEGIRRQLLQTLQRAGLKEIATNGRFDPFMHEALMREQTDDGDEGRILEVFQKGYTLGPKVIRAARVKVAVGTPAPETDSGHDEDSQDDDDYEDQIAGKGE